MSSGCRKRLKLAKMAFCAALVLEFGTSCSAKMSSASKPAGSVYLSSSQADHGQQSSSSLSKEKFIAYLSRYDSDSGRAAADPAEWITLSDRKRIKELHLTQADMPDGFCVYNPKKETKLIKIAKNAKISIFGNTGNTPIQTDLDGLADRISASPASVFWLTIQNGMTTAVEEQYLP